MRQYLTILFLLVGQSLFAQSFDEHFEDNTLRLDYIFAGDNKRQSIHFQRAYKTSKWAGRHTHLSNILLRGNGQIIVRQHDSDSVLYTHSFSTLFQEWLATEEATQVSKAFDNSFQIPYPKHPVDITVSLTDFHNQVTCQLTHTINPADILIRHSSDNSVPHTSIMQSGDLTDCVDIAIIADGYTDGEMDKFRRDCQRAVDAIFSHEPFASLRNRFNVVAVESPSPESGPSIPHEGIWKRNAAGTSYDTFYTTRYLMTSDIHRIYDLLDGIPFEHIIVLVNTSTYGGGGIYNQITVSPTDHPTFKQVLVHEFGHSYGGLGDEYFYDDQYESTYPADTEPWEPNLTTLVDFDSKWADLLPKGTPIPTPPADIPDYRTARSPKDKKALNQATQRVGVFEGGGYQSKGVYRPAQECRMKVNEVELFCPVCSRAIQRITDFYTSK